MKVIIYSMVLILGVCIMLGLFACFNVASDYDDSFEEDEGDECETSEN